METEREPDDENRRHCPRCQAYDPTLIEVYEGLETWKCYACNHEWQEGIPEQRP